MKKNIIIGAGFAAIFAKLLVGKNSKIIGSLDHKTIKNKNYLRRKSVEFNKLFSLKAFSYGSLDFNLKHGKLHDRLILGGNSNIWGGHINLEKIPNKFLKLLKFYNIKTKKLSYKETGTISNNKNFHQLQTEFNKTIKAQDVPVKIENGYIEKFYVSGRKIYINIKNKKKEVKKILVTKLYLCIGTVQLIDLLYRSNFLKENDNIEFSEFYHRFKWNIIYSGFDKKINTIRYRFSKALGNYFGIQSYTKYLRILQFIPLCIDQNWHKKKIKYKLKIKNKTLVDNISKNNSYEFFGKSIHYCNMKINGVSINKFLFKINPNIKGFGMSFVDQKTPGPIANDIILDIKKKLNIK